MIKVKNKAGRFTSIVLSAVLCVSLGSFSAHAASITPQVNQHTQDEIRAKVKTNGLDKSPSTTYSTAPASGKTYNIGKVSDASLRNGLNALNGIRYIAGLDDNVVLDGLLIEKAQAAAYISYRNGALSHSPTKPSGMSDDMYSLCLSGAGSSNLCMGVNSFTDMLFMYMDDSGFSNIDRVGHRRWILNPPMGKTGMGMAGAYSALSVFDDTGTGQQSYVAWPAQQMPIDYFADNQAWSVSTGKQEDANSIDVTLTRKSDNRVMKFNKNSTGDNVFHVDNTGYGLSGCIIWRPADLEYESGDVFHVHIDGASEGVIDYDVTFFRLVPPTDVSSSTLEKISSIEVGTEKQIKTTLIPAETSAEVVFSSSDDKVIKVDESGWLVAKKKGTATITLRADDIVKSYTIKVIWHKKAQPMKVNVRRKTISSSKLKKKSRKVKVFTVKKAKGTITYQKKSGSSRLAINPKTGVITIKKKTKKGVYRMKVKVTASGNERYKAGSKTVKVKIIVR